LNLAETPQIAAVDNLLKALILVVKGKAEMPDTAIIQRCLARLRRSCFKTISRQRLRLRA